MLSFFGQLEMAASWRLIDFNKMFTVKLIHAKNVDFSEEDDSQTCVEEWELTRCVDDIQKVNENVL